MRESVHRRTKISAAFLAVGLFSDLFGISVFYSGFLVIPPTIGDLKFAIGFFYAPLVAAVLALGALILKFRPGLRNAARLLSQVGLIMTGTVVIWWTIFEPGTLPMVMLPIIFLAVVINDWKERKESASGSRI